MGRQAREAETCVFEGADRRTDLMKYILLPILDVFFCFFFNGHVSGRTDGGRMRMTIRKDVLGQPSWVPSCSFELPEELWSRTLCRAVLQVEDCSPPDDLLAYHFERIKIGLASYTSATERKKIGDIHSSTQSSLNPLYPGWLCGPVVTRSTHSSKWCL